MAMSIRCGHCGRRHKSVVAVRRCGQGGGQGGGHGGSARDTVATPVHVARPGPATVGLYRKFGQIYAVDYFGSSGRLVAKRLDTVAKVDGTSYRMVPAPGMATRLTQADRMAADEAKAFGKLTGVCVRCARHLEHPDSVAAGIGPVCAKKI